MSKRKHRIMNVIMMVNKNVLIVVQWSIKMDNVSNKVLSQLAQE